MFLSLSEVLAWSVGDERKQALPQVREAGDGVAFTSLLHHVDRLSRLRLVVQEFREEAVCFTSERIWIMLVSETLPESAKQHFTGYLCRMLRNCSINLLRKRQSQDRRAQRAALVVSEDPEELGEEEKRALFALLRKTALRQRGLHWRRDLEIGIQLMERQIFQGVTTEQLLAEEGVDRVRDPVRFKRARNRLQQRTCRARRALAEAALCLKGSAAEDARGWVKKMR